MKDANAKRFELIKAMNTIICSLASDKAYNAWLDVIPDAAEVSEAKLLNIACTPDWFCDAVQVFNRIIRNYGKDGFMINGEVFK